MNPVNIWEIITAISTSLTVIIALFIALFGERIRKQLNRPFLRLTISNQCGEINYINNHEPAFFYFLHVSNTKWRLPANDAQVFLIKLEDKMAGLKWQDTNGIPLRWKHHEYYKGRMLIGCDIDCDICSINKLGFFMDFELYSYNTMRFLENSRSSCDLIADYQIKYNEGVSKKFRFHFKWDGVFDENPNNMKKHFSLKEINSK